MRFKKAIGLALCVSMMLGCLAGCGKEEQPEESGESSEYPFKVEDLNGYVFTVADSNVNRWFPEEGSSEIGNAIINRVETVERLFNCEIERIDFNGEEAARAAMAGTKYADIIVSPTYAMARYLLKSKALVDINTLEGLNLDAEYWTRWGDTSILKYHDKIYALGAPFACQHDEAFVIFFNKAIIEELNLESPYDLYARDEWTMSKLLDYCRAAKKDLNGDGVFDENDRYGFICGHMFDGPFVLYMGAGGKILRETEDGHFEFELNTKDAFRLVNQIKEILDPFENSYKNNGNLGQLDATNVFVNGQTLFYCYSRGRGMADAIYDMEDDFGIVPMPKGDNAGPNEYNCWVSHDAANMGIMANNPDIEKTIMITEALAYFSQEENEIEENEFLANKLRDDTARDIVQNINQYAMIDYAWVGWQLGENGAYNEGFNDMIWKVWDVAMSNSSNQIMATIQSVEKKVEISIQELEDVLNQRN
nr:ABC transporter substrate-binding protein [uncultured Acetatifactor sp.]